MSQTTNRYPTTPDGRYFVVRGRLWRCSDPALDETEHQSLVKKLMNARRQIAAAKKAEDKEQMATAREQVHEAKVALGERGPVWWTDGSPDYNRYLAKNTPYASWYSSLPITQQK